MTADGLRNFRKRLGLAQTALAAALGVSERALGRYELNYQPIPKTVALACSALAFGLPPME